VVPEKPYSEIKGEVKDGVVPANVLEPVMTAGDCTLFQRSTPTCTPECDEVGTVCGTEGSCVPDPRNQDVGSVTITGLKDAQTMEPRAPLNTYQNVGNLQHPAFDDGAPITLSATGGVHAPFGLAAEGVAPFGLDESVVLADGMPVVLSWTPPAQPDRSHVIAKLDIALHGGDPVYIECDAPDTGTLEISADLIDGLLSYAFSGNPRIYLARQTAGSVQTDLGCVDLVVAAREVLEVTIEGYVSCSDMMPCPMGQVCGMEMFCE